jgi:hypothetical protein
VDRVHDRCEPVMQSGPRWTTSARRTSARPLWSSPTVVEGDEGDDAVREGCSLENKRWQTGDAMMAESGGSSSSMREWRRVRESEGERCGVHWGV